MKAMSLEPALCSGAVAAAAEGSARYAKNRGVNSACLEMRYNMQPRGATAVNVGGHNDCAACKLPNIISDLSYSVG